jgi:hypothetical protein
MLKYGQWLAINEGGWTSKKTQATKITPAVLKKADAYVQQMVADYGKWLEKNYPGTAPLVAVRPVGSGVYYEKDLEEAPEKVYGDIDYLIQYPVFADAVDKRKAETEAVRWYNRELFHFFADTKYPGVIVEESKGADGGTGVLIVEVEKDIYIQVDMVITHAEYREWAMDRFTPIRNIKGFVSGNLYSSMADALMISMGDRGARAKLQDGALVPFKMRKNSEEIAISLNFKTLFKDVVDFFCRLKGVDPVEVSVPGINTGNLSLGAIANGIAALADSLERNELLDGKTLKFKDAAEMKAEIARIYAQKMAGLRADKKFDKAEDPMAVAAKEKIFAVSQAAEEEVSNILG